MFDAFDGQRQKANRKRFLGPTAISIAAYALIGGSVALFAGSGGHADVPEDEPIDVVLEKKPKPATPPPPSPVQAAPKPPDAPKRARSSAPPPPALQAPKEMPKQAPPEDDAAKLKDTGAVDPGANYGDGDPDGEDKPGPAKPEPTPTPTPTPAPAAPKKKMEPVDLPENAQPPVPDAGNQPPSYPDAARAAGQEGLVILKLAISEKGKIRSIEVLKSDPAFDDAAIDAVRHWKFSPATVNGQPIAVFRIVKIPFRLGS